MPLTPEDVSNKRFTPVRLREGYDMGEVDQFLDEIESELSRLLKENDDLRSKAGLSGAPAAAAGEKVAPAAEEPAAPAPAKAEQPAAAPTPAATPAEAPSSSGHKPSPHEQITVTTSAEAGAAASRLLELATRNADEVVAEARQQADGILTQARTEAEQLETQSRERADQVDRETKDRADKLDADARTRAQNLDAETQAKRSEALTSIEQEKERLDHEVENLRAFEREYRSRLKSYFTQQLEALDGRGEGGELPAGHGHPQDPAE
ncbi:DivIVA domain-containing protein [Nocardioides scoriae]|uniref:Cell wall synthesis protein Wag31 n=1 Tax=Nocardioides scoriae TaxID=642780 RepID=A0A1H1L8P1_9ACTN|nr:DivIVA domain-containing protein [Nocardioides scoriae]SDR70710.1 DivIVA domain-containing protein [Nocardioides scoriae]